MILYHGTTTKIQRPEIIVNEVGRDFGFAFCTQESLQTLKFVKCYTVRS